MFVSVSVPANVVKEPSCNALLNSAVVPVKVPSPKSNVNVLLALSIVLFVSVCEPVRVATVASMFNVIEFPEPTESNPVPPAIVNVSLSKSIARAPPESP